MKRIKLTIAYDGTDYCGWQIQPNGITAVSYTHLDVYKRQEYACDGWSRHDGGMP